MVVYYGESSVDHSDYNDSRVALDKLTAFNDEMRRHVESVENFVKLVSIERDLNGVTNLVTPNRVREIYGFYDM